VHVESEEVVISANHNDRFSLVHKRYSKKYGQVCASLLARKMVNITCQKSV
jgi:hypothetical protein